MQFRALGRKAETHSFGTWSSVALHAITAEPMSIYAPMRQPPGSRSSPFAPSPTLALSPVDTSRKTPFWSALVIAWLMENRCLVEHSPRRIL